MTIPATPTTKPTLTTSMITNNAVNAKVAVATTLELMIRVVQPKGKQVTEQMLPASWTALPSRLLVFTAFQRNYILSR